MTRAEEGAQARPMAYEMHCSGMTIREISDALDMPPDDARRAVVGEWRRDKMAARAEKIDRWAVMNL